MRCSSCEKFVSNEDADPEVESVDDTEGSDSPTVDVRRIRVCADCGTEMKEATLTVEGTDPVFTLANEYLTKDAPDDTTYDPTICPARRDPEAEGEQGEPCEWEWEAEAENTDRSEGKGRGLKTFYGVLVRFNATCKHCGSTAAAEGSDDVAASGMDELS